MAERVACCRCSFSDVAEANGFERAAAIAGQPARAIARTAEQFGHDDDITVLGALRLAAEPVAIAQLPELSPAPA